MPKPNFVFELVFESYNLPDAFGFPIRCNLNHDHHLTLVTSEGPKGIFSKVIFLKLVLFNEKDESCHGFVVHLKKLYSTLPKIQIREQPKIIIVKGCCIRK